MKCKSLKILAETLGLQTRQIEYYRRDGMPGSQGSWDTSIIVPWIIAHVSGQKRKESRTQSEDDEEDQLNRKRRIEADTLQIKLDILRGNVLPTDELKTVTSMMASMLRNLGEKFEKQFGVDAADLLNDSLDEIQASFNETVSIIDDRSIAGILADDSEEVDGELSKPAPRRRKKAKNSKSD